MTKTKSAQICTLQYDFIDNGDAELMLVVEQTEDKPESAVFYFDGCEGFLKRRPDQFVAFPFIDHEVKTLLEKTEKILVAEMKNNDEIGDVYTAPVVIVEKGAFPFPDDCLKDTDND